MRAIICIVLLAPFAMASDKPHYDINNAPALFEKFIQDHNKQYKDEADRQSHYEAFVRSLNTINKANSEHGSATFDINKFADHTPEDRKNLFGFKKPEN